MKIKAYFTFWVILTVSTACSRKQNVFQGEVQGLKAGDRIVLAVQNLNGPGRIPKDSTVVSKDNEFTLKTSVTDEYGFLTLLKPGESFNPESEGQPRIFLEGFSEIRVKGNTENWHYLRPSGGLYEHPDMQAINQITWKALDIQQNALQLLDQAEKNGDSLQQAEGMKLIDESNDMLMSVDSLEKVFRLKNPDNAYSAALLRYEYLDMADFSEYEKAFEQLSPRVQASPAGREIALYIQQKKTSEPGAVAPDFAIKDTTGKIIRLSDYRGKYVLLNFWGSWCAPCRESLPKLKELYTKVQGKDLVMIGIACREQSETWKKSIREEGLEWLQLNDAHSPEGQSVQKMYAIDGVPTCVLIDPEGKILYKEHPYILILRVEYLLLKK